MCAPGREEQVQRPRGECESGVFEEIWLEAEEVRLSGHTRPVKPPSGVITC